jgi:hypothetical protein
MPRAAVNELGAELLRPGMPTHSIPSSPRPEIGRHFRGVATANAGSPRLATNQAMAGSQRDRPRLGATIS